MSSRNRSELPGLLADYERVLRLAEQQAAGDSNLRNTARQYQTFFQRNLQVLAEQPELFLQQAANWQPSVSTAALNLLNQDSSPTFTWLQQKFSAQDQADQHLHWSYEVELPVAAVASSPDGNYVAAVIKRQILIFDGSTGVLLQTVEADSVPRGEQISGISWSPDSQELAIACSNGEIHLWTVNSDPKSRVAKVEGDIRKPALLCISWSADGAWLATGSTHGAVTLRAGKSDQWHTPTHIDGAAVKCVSWSPRETTLAAGCADGSILICDMAGTLRHTIPAHKRSVNCLCWSPDGTSIVSGSEDGTIVIFDAQSGTLQRSFRGHCFAVCSVTWMAADAASGNDRIISAGNDPCIFIWQLNSETPLQTLNAADGVVSSLSAPHRGEWYVSGSGSGTESGMICRRSIPAAPLSTPVLTHERSVKSLSWSSDGRFVASASDDGQVAIWSTADGKRLHCRKLSESWIQAVCWSPDDTQLAAASVDGTLFILSAADGAEMYKDTHSQQIECLCWDSVHSGILLGLQTGAVVLWNPVNHSIALPSNKLHKRGITCLNSSPKGDRFVTASWDGQLKIWTVSVSQSQLCTQTLHTLQGHFGAVKAAAWSPSADQIVSGGSDTLLRVWNVANGSELHRIEGHRGTINAAVWSSDGTRIISGSEDRTVRIWDSESGRQLNLFPTGSPVQSLAATMDASGQLQIVAGLDSGALIWLELCHSKQEKKVE